MPLITEETETDLIFVSRLDEYMDVYELYQKHMGTERGRLLNGQEGIRRHVTK
jgi:hypothetical protein